MKYEIYKDIEGKWRCRLVAKNGKILMSSQAYEDKADALHCIKLSKSAGRFTRIVDLTEEK